MLNESRKTSKDFMQLLNDCQNTKYELDSSFDMIFGIFMSFAGFKFSKDHKSYQSSQSPRPATPDPKSAPDPFQLVEDPSAPPQEDMEQFLKKWVAAYKAKSSRDSDLYSKRILPPQSGPLKTVRFPGRKCSASGLLLDSDVFAADQNIPNRPLYNPYTKQPLAIPLRQAPSPALLPDALTSPQAGAHGSPSPKSNLFPSFKSQMATSPQPSQEASFPGQLIHRRPSFMSNEEEPNSPHAEGVHQAMNPLRPSAPSSPILPCLSPSLRKDSL